VDRTARDLQAAHEREAAIREILRVINRSPDDYGPVFDAILERATRLCEAELGLLLLREADGLHCVAHRGTRPEVAAYYHANPIPLDPEKTVLARSLADGRPMQVLDLADDPVYRAGFEHRRLAVEVDGARCQLTVPLVQGEEGIGVILIYRREVRAFDAVHEELLIDFAEMAVIALENVRRFKALNLSLERQTATSEILRTISRSPTDYGPVFDAILDNATRLCEAPLAFLLMREGGAFHFVAHRGSRQAFVAFVQANPVPVDSEGTLAALAARSGVAQQLADITDSESYRAGTSVHRVASADIEGIRTGLFVPMMKGEECVGIVALYRREVRPFEDSHVALASTFADQAVIAVENVRSFQAIEARTAELTRSLERQTATSEILRTISRSPTDYGPVFDAILDNATRPGRQSWREPGVRRVLEGAPLPPHSQARDHRARRHRAGARADRRPGRRAARRCRPPSRHGRRHRGNPHPSLRADAQGQRDRRRDWPLSPRGQGLRERRGRDSVHLCRPGRHRHRERAPFPGNPGAHGRADALPGAPDRHQ
jgi:GAF domain-containing protein